SPSAPLAPVPAMVLSRPFGSSLRTRWPSISAMKRLPSVSMSTANGSCSSPPIRALALAGAPAVRKARPVCGRGVPGGRGHKAGGEQGKERKQGSDWKVFHGSFGVLCGLSLCAARNRPGVEKLIEKLPRRRLLVGGVKGQGIGKHFSQLWVVRKKAPLTCR